MSVCSYQKPQQSFLPPCCFLLSIIAQRKVFSFSAFWHPVVQTCPSFIFNGHLKFQLKDLLLRSLSCLLNTVLGVFVSCPLFLSQIASPDVTSHSAQNTVPAFSTIFISESSPHTSSFSFYRDWHLTGTRIRTDFNIFKVFSFIKTTWIISNDQQSVALMNLKRSMRFAVFHVRAIHRCLHGSQRLHTPLLGPLPSRVEKMIPYKCQCP